MAGLSGQILVDTAVMVSKAEELSKSISRARESFDDIQKQVSSTVYYWVGEAGDHYRSLFSAEKEQIEIILNRLREHPADLKLMAQGYSDAETAIRDDNLQLQSDYI